MAVKTKIKPTVKTLDEAVILMLERMAESNDRTDRLIAESNDRTDRLIAESNSRTDRLIAESNDRTDRVMAESQAKTDLAIQRLTENLEDLRLRVAEVLTGLGTTGNRLGDI